MSAVAERAPVARPNGAFVISGKGAPGALSRPRGKATGRIVGPEWRPSDGIDLAAWTEQGRRLGRHARWSKWWVGDWLIYGNSRWGEKYTRAANILGYDVKTLANMVYVANRFETSRRREDLSWSHHEVVAALTVDKQDEWLERASAERLSVRDLRHEVHRCARPPRADGSRLAAAGNGGTKQRTPVAAVVLTSHVVRDLEVSIGFYTALGLEVVHRGLNNRSDEEAFLGPPGDQPRLELVQSETAQTSAALDAHDGLHTTVWVSEVAPVLKRLASHNVQPCGGDSEVESVFVRDPDGYVVKLVDAPTWTAVVDGAAREGVCPRKTELAALAS